MQSITSAPVSMELPPPNLKSNSRSPPSFCTLSSPSASNVLRHVKSQDFDKRRNFVLFRISKLNLKTLTDNLFWFQIAGVNITNFMNVSEELTSSGQAKEFTNPIVFHHLFKELFHIVTNRFLAPITHQNADTALHYCKVWKQLFTFWTLLTCIFLRLFFVYKLCEI